jgi:hypothetical protein
MVAHYCSICEEGILNGEDYVKNCLGDYAHYDCVTSMGYRNMLEWAECEVRTMESEE